MSHTTMFLIAYYVFGVIATPFAYGLTLAFFQDEFPDVRDLQGDRKISAIAAACTALAPVCFLMVLYYTRGCKHGLKFRAEGPVRDEPETTTVSIVYKF